MASFKGKNGKLMIGGESLNVDFSSVKIEFDKASESLKEFSKSVAKINLKAAYDEGLMQSSAQKHPNCRCTVDTGKLVDSILKLPPATIAPPVTGKPKTLEALQHLSDAEHLAKLSADLFKQYAIPEHIVKPTKLSNADAHAREAMSSTHPEDELRAKSCDTACENTINPKRKIEL